MKFAMMLQDVLRSFVQSADYGEVSVRRRRRRPIGCAAS